MYFLLIGLGFMFIEIGLIQRISVFMGHPILCPQCRPVQHHPIDGAGKLAFAKVNAGPAGRHPFWLSLLVDLSTGTSSLAARIDPLRRSNPQD